MSFCNRPVVAAKNAVSAPTQVITTSVVGANSSSGDDRNNKYTPAVTSVALWIKAETGVGKEGKLLYLLRTVYYPFKGAN